MQYSAYSKHLQSQTNFTETENGATTLKSSLSGCVDFFYATLSSQEEYYKKFLVALVENRETALKILFWHRDVRENGMGRRSNFRHVLSKLNEWSNPGDFSTNAIYHYGRSDDLLSLLDTKAGANTLSWIKLQLEAKNSLVAKWMPRESSGKANYRFYARRIAKFLGWSSKEYRKNISALTKVVEQEMTAKKWDQIDFNKVPSQASLRYKNAFERNASQSYAAWQQSLIRQDGSAKVNAATLLPHQIVQKYGFMHPSNFDATLEAMWTALPKQQTNCLVVADTSGSMSGTPMAVSLSLAMYFAERNPYKGFITFSNEPQWHYINEKGTLRDNLMSIQSINIQSTNLEATFDLLFSTYVKTKMMPETILIISDMEFNQAIGAQHSWGNSNLLDKKTFFNKMKSKFNNWNIPFPKIVFWNVREETSGVPVSFDTTGTALIAGYDPSVMQTIMASEDFDPITIMNQAILQINPNL